MVTYHSQIGSAAWSDLLRLLKDARVSDLRGVPKMRTVGGRSYWYDHFRIGSEVVDRYIGEDSEELRARLERAREIGEARKTGERERARLMRILRAEGYLMSDAATGQIISAMERSGVFRLGGTLVGTQAFRLYEGELGVRIAFDQSAITDDIDIANFERLSIALGDTVNESLADVFSTLKFEPLPPLEKSKVWRWRQTDRSTLVEFLTPSFEEHEGLRDLPALGVSAQSLHHLNYLIADPIQVPFLYRSGALVQIPRPERFAIHKLIIADRRRADPDQLKARKDRAQAAFLIEVLSEERPEDLLETYEAAREKGPQWRARLDATLKRMPETRARLDALR
ncbi:nucleotidyltransferase family protein [Solirhodobacter olei]|uniref:nucleotidyltransferase family protein n=1 Tax=Solirhodobacter olei TaxID=2493082 RepID=UPI000FD81C19|nr:GSU2403 family nucleotidyltransferase fold protein [Solirhodobacter olei]